MTEIALEVCLQPPFDSLVGIAIGAIATEGECAETVATELDVVLQPQAPARLLIEVVAVEPVEVERKHVASGAVVQYHHLSSSAHRQSQEGQQREECSVYLLESLSVVHDGYFILICKYTK